MTARTDERPRRQIVNISSRVVFLTLCLSLAGSAVGLLYINQSLFGPLFVVVAHVYFALLVLHARWPSRGTLLSRFIVASLAGIVLFFVVGLVDSALVSAFPVVRTAAPASLVAILILVLVTLSLVPLFLSPREYKLRFEWLRLDILFLTLLLVLLLAAVLSIQILNLSGDPLIPLLAYGGILAASGMLFLRAHRISPWAAPACLYLIGLSFLFSLSLRSAFVVGFDVSLEMAFYEITRSNGRWSYDLLPMLYNSSLAVTVYPYQLNVLAGIPATTTFKVIFPALFASIGPLLYELFREWFRERDAMLGALLILGQTQFISLAGIGKQEIALALFAGLLFVLFRSRRSGVPALLSTFLALGIIMSHYAVAIFASILFLTVSVWHWKGATNGLSRTPVTREHAFAFLAMLFLWLAYTASSGFSGLVQTFARTMNLLVLGGFQENVSTRNLQPQTLLDTVGLLGFGIGMTWKILMGLGVLIVVLRILRRKDVTVGKQYALMSFLGLAVVASASLVPVIERTFTLGRFLLQSVLFIAPFAAIGLWGIIRYLRSLLHQPESRRLVNRNVQSAAIVLLVVVYLASGTGWIYAVAGSKTDALNFQNTGEFYDRFYFQASEVAGARWASQSGINVVYTDRYGLLRLVGYGSFLDEERFRFENGLPSGATSIVFAVKYERLADSAYVNAVLGDYFFLRSENVDKGTAKFLSGQSVFTTIIADDPLLTRLIAPRPRIYDSGSSVILGPAG